MSVLVAGIGNLFLGDDAFGVEVARRLLADPPPGTRVVDYGIRALHFAFALLEPVSLLVVADDAGGVDLYDTSDPRRPVLASEFRFDRAEDGVASSVAVDGRHIYVPSWDGGVNVFDVVLDDNFRP